MAWILMAVSVGITVDNRENVSSCLPHRKCMEIGKDQKLSYQQ